MNKDMNKEHLEYVTRETPTGQSTVTRETHEREQKRQQEQGRYTLNEAAMFLSEQDGRADLWLEKLRKAVADESLPMYEPGSEARYYSKTVREFYEETRWHHLNDWLKATEHRIRWRFPAPLADDQHGNDAKSSTDKFKIPRQKDMILKIIRDFGHEPTALPPYKRGTSEIKKAIRQKCLESPKLFTDTAFEHAWDALRAAGKISDAKP